MRGRTEEVAVASHPAPLPRRLAAEAFGTFALVFVAVGGHALAGLFPDDVPSFALAVAPALTVAALIYAIGDVSGAHFNPVVSAAFALRRLFPGREVIPYWVAQLAGAAAATATIAQLFPETVSEGVSTPHVAPLTAAALEAALTTLLIVVILGTADRARIVGPNAAIAVAATISLAGLVALPAEGASMNPARSLAPALVLGQLQDAWIYVIGPVVGAVLATALAYGLHGSADPSPKTEEAARGSEEADEGE